MRLGTGLGLAGWALLLLGCEQKGAPARLYFKPPLAPVGIEARVVRDENSNSPEGGTILLTAVVERAVDRDELDTLMRSFHRQVGARAGFHGGAPERIDLRFYATDAAAQAGGEDWLGQLLQVSSGSTPVLKSRQPLPLLKWAQAALGPLPQFTSRLKPKVSADASRLSVRVEMPFVEQDGSGKAVERVSFELAATTLTSTLKRLFDGVSTLKEVTFLGTHGGKVLVEATLSRREHDQLGLQDVEERLGALRGKIVADLLQRSVPEALLELELAAKRRALYREAFAKLPAGRVRIDPKLR